MDQSNVSVRLVPVSVRPEGHDGLPTLVGLRGPEGRWVTSPLKGSAQGTAQALMPEVLPSPAALLDGQHLKPRPVGFAEGPERDQHGVVLIYTLALPMALAAAGDGDEWVPLLRPIASAREARKAGDLMIADEPHAVELIDFWRQGLEETAAGLLFLAKYWTVPQLRDVYSAVWGYEQDAAAFIKWADPRGRPGVFARAAVEVDVDNNEEDRLRVDDDFARVLAEGTARHESGLQPGFSSYPTYLGGGPTGPGGIAGSAMVALDPQAFRPWRAVASSLRPGRSVGLSLSGAAAGIPALAVLGAAAAVAYQSSTRGPRPRWFTADGDGDPLDSRLARLYQPRPAWQHVPDPD